MDGIAVMLQAGIVPFTVTTAVHVETLPAKSVTVSVTLLAPILVQLKLVFDNTMVAIPQLSVLALFTLATVIVAEPPTNVTVTGLLKLRVLRNNVDKIVGFLHSIDKFG